MSRTPAAVTSMTAPRCLALTRARFHQPPASAGSRSAAHRGSPQRHQSSFIPGYSASSTGLLPPKVPKPPSPHFYTAKPSIVDHTSHLASLIHSSRVALQSAGILKRYADPPNFYGTGIRLRWLRWSAREALGKPEGELSPAERELRELWSGELRWRDVAGVTGLWNLGTLKLKLTDHASLVEQLDELRALQRYTYYASTLPELPNHGVILELKQKVSEALRPYIKPTEAKEEVRARHGVRDVLGRYYGLGRKKEASCRAWIVEVHDVEPRLVPEPAPTGPPSAPSAHHRAGPSDSSPAGSTDVAAPAAAGVPKIGQVLINGKPLSQYFPSPADRSVVLRPFEITRSLGHYNAHLLVHSGGRASQAHAAAHALARALLAALTDRKTALSVQERWAKKVLTRSGSAKRDPRVVERKKTGRKGAKAGYTWVKR